MPTDIARTAAIGTGLSMILSIAIDARASLRNLVRADLLALISLYYLTFFEFLFPQSAFETMVDISAAHRAVIACLFGFGGLVVGRHLLRLRKQPFTEMFTAPVSTTLILSLFTICFFVGFSYMLACSDWNPITMVSWFSEPRFAQPWSREALGDWKALLHELEMLLFLVPPLGGVILARRKRYSISGLIFVSLAVLFVLFYGFSSGTRYFLAAYLITLLAGFAFAASAEQKREIIVAAILSAGFMVISTVAMLEFRQIGLRAYVTHDYEDFRRPEREQTSLYVDYNLYAICQIVEAFPSEHDYLGWEIPYLAAIRPIPRALWPGKPEGMSYSIEDVVGAKGWTVAATFVGEAYMSDGFFGVFVIGCVLGLLAQWWNLLASPRNSEFGVLIYASGFFAAAISMRSMLVLTTALLPSVVSIILGFLVIRRAVPIQRMRRPVRVAAAPPRALTRP